MKNLEIRLLLAEKRIKHYELAKAMGISDTTLSKKLRFELSNNQKQEIIEIINELARNK